MAAVLSVLKVVGIANLVIKNREKLIYALCGLIMFLTMIVGAMTSILIPSIEFGETVWEQYENAANIMGADLQHIIVFDQARTWNRFDDVDPYETAVYFADITIEDHVTTAQYMLLNPTTPEEEVMIKTFDEIPEEEFDLWFYVGEHDTITNGVSVHGIHAWNYLVDRGYISPIAPVNIYTLIDGLETYIRPDVVYGDSTEYATYELKAMTLFDFKVSAYLDEKEAEYAFLLIHNNIVNGMTGDTSIFDLYGTFLDVISTDFFTNPNPDLVHVSSEYGYRMHPIYNDFRLHTGIDLTKPGGSMGVPIGAIADGIVTEVKYSNSGLGYRVRIQHTDENGVVWESGYGHCAFIIVREGQRVQKGEVIAGVGNTGGSTGAHLHFEIKRNGVYVNPRTILGF